MLSFIFVSLLVASILTAIVGVVVFFIQLTWPLFLIFVAIILVIGLIGIIVS